VVWNNVRTTPKRPCLLLTLTNECRQASWTIGSSAGPLIGGAISKMTTWRWMFYIMFPFCGYGLICVPWLLTLKPREMRTTREKLRRIDWVGSLTFLAGTTLFLMAISWGGSQFAWNSAGELLPLCFGLIGIAATFVWGRYFTGQPLLNTALFSSASATFCYICGGIQGLLVSLSTRLWNRYHTCLPCNSSLANCTTFLSTLSRSRVLTPSTQAWPCCP
jgi:MFS family permease